MRSLTRKKNGGENGYNGRDHGTKRKRGQARRGRNDVINLRVAPRMIIDPGTEIDVIGGVGWFILNVVDGMTANLGGALAGMGERRLHIVSAVTAYDHETEGPILIGHGQVAWDNQPEQTECLINSHSLRHNDVTVDDVTMRDGGKQKITISRTEVKLDFFDEKHYHSTPGNPPRMSCTPSRYTGCARSNATPSKRTIGRRRTIGYQQTTSKPRHPGKTDSHAHQR